MNKTWVASWAMAWAGVGVAGMGAMSIGVMSIGAMSIGAMTVAIAPAQAQTPAQPQALFVAYPPANHKTTADRIFLIGTAAPGGSVTVNGQGVDRSPGGHFAPTFALQLGENQFTLRRGNEELKLTVTRVSAEPQVPQGLAFAAGSLEPGVNWARQVGERVCFGAIAPPQAQVSVRLGSRLLPLTEVSASVDLPENSAVLTGRNTPTARSVAGKYQACTRFTTAGSFQPQYELKLKGQTKTEAAAGQLEILSPEPITVATVTAPEGIARTGPSSSYSRLTPLPQGTKASITGKEGDWLRLDYGAWIKASETTLATAAVPPTSMIRSLSSRVQGGWTEVVFPLQTPVPIRISQATDSLTLTLYNTTAQTDTIYTGQDPIIDRLDWQQPRPGEVNYTIRFKTTQQWGFKTRYEGTSLILSLKHPPQTPKASPLKGMKIFVDPGHGSAEDLGARGPTGYPEKDVVLKVSKLFRDQLQKQGATVIMAREGDDDLYPQDRVDRMVAAQPDLALSLHYNALPDNGDAANTRGIGVFWYHPQAHGLAQFLHDDLTQKLKRPSYGVFWNNLALTRPSLTPALLLELGFMINPEEFEWIVDEASQIQLAKTLADSVAAWAAQTTHKEFYDR